MGKGDGDQISGDERDKDPGHDHNVEGEQTFQENRQGYGCQPQCPTGSIDIIAFT